MRNVLIIMKCQYFKSRKFILLNNYSYYLALRKTNLKRAEELILIVFQIPQHCYLL